MVEHLENANLSIHLLQVHFAQLRLIDDLYRHLVEEIKRQEICRVRSLLKIMRNVCCFKASEMKMYICTENVDRICSSSFKYPISFQGVNEWSLRHWVNVVS